MIYTGEILLKYGEDNNQQQYNQQQYNSFFPLISYIYLCWDTIYSDLVEVSHCDP